MAAQHGTILHFQRHCQANTVSSAITIPTGATPVLKMLICPSSKEIPVFYLIRDVGSSTEPTTVANNANGSGSPCVPPGVPVEISHLPSTASELVFKCTQATDVTVLIYHPSV